MTATMTASFDVRLRQVQEERRSLLCVGLDPDMSRLPEHLQQRADAADAVLWFNAAIIEATTPVTAAFKLNLAFYEVLGPEGWRVLKSTISRIPDDTPVILDGKRGDIGNTARRYAEAFFEELKADACTVSPYMGYDAVSPFLEYEGKATFVLTRTSNEGAAAIQECTVEGEAMYRRVARLAETWAADKPGSLGLVVGATTPHALAQVRAVSPSSTLLIPGVGAQGGNPAIVMDVASSGTGTMLINSSRSILYASNGKDFASAAADAARSLREQVKPWW